MKLIIGLGNPGDAYKNTYHNLGFMVVEKCAKFLETDFTKTKCKALIAEKVIAGEKVLIVKPQTFMNLSGESVSELVSYFKIPLEDVIVAYDDYDLNKGEVRIRPNGSAGTHNGMRNIISHIGENFARIRLGFKQDGVFEIPLIDYVLSGIKKEDEEVFRKAIENSAKACFDFARGMDLSSIMQKYNTRKSK